MKMIYAMVAFLCVFLTLGDAMAAPADDQELSALSDQRRQERIENARADAINAEKQKIANQVALEEQKLKLRAVKEVQKALDENRNPDEVWIKILGSGAGNMGGQQRGGGGGSRQSQVSQQVLPPSVPTKPLTVTKDDGKPTAVMVEHIGKKASVLFFYKDRYISASPGDMLTGTDIRFLDFTDRDTVKMLQAGKVFTIGLDSSGSRYDPEAKKAAANTSPFDVAPPQIGDLRGGGPSEMPYMPGPQSMPPMPQSMRGVQ